MSDLLRNNVVSKRDNGASREEKVVFKRIGKNKGNSPPGGKGPLSKKALIIIGACVLAVGLGVAAYFIITDSIQTAFLMQGDTAAKGVTVNGISIEDMTLEEAKAATAHIPGEVLGKVSISIDIDGEKYKYGPADLGIGTDYEDVITQAVNYVHTGTLEERKKALALAGSAGMAFTVKPVATRESLSAVLLPLKASLDRTVADAAFTFMPWGYLENGAAYEADKQALIESCASKTPLTTTPALARIAQAEMPNKLRYQYWNTRKYVDGYIPPDASISRFLYQPDVQGRDIDMDQVMEAIIGQLQGGTYTEIIAPVQKTDPTVKLDTIKKKTGLIASWTSSYASHKSYNRNWNVAKLSGIINGVIIQPGETWSINKHAGNRTVAGGWKKAPGISGGGYTMQAGGGVCQISSTLYNAAIRAGMKCEASHHSISSNYIPPGLDATISSDGPDLKLTNNNTEPVYIVSYFNVVDQNVTVEIYGQSVADPQYGDVILDFSWESTGRYGEPGMNYVYSARVAPDGHELQPGEHYEFAAPRYAQTVHTYRHWLKLDGTEIKKEEFEQAHWTVKNGTTYVYDDAPVPSGDGGEDGGTGG